MNQYSLQCRTSKYREYVRGIRPGGISQCLEICMMRSLTLPCYSWRNARLPSLVFGKLVNCQSEKISVDGTHKQLGIDAVISLFMSQVYDIPDMLLRRRRKERASVASSEK